MQAYHFISPDLKTRYDDLQAAVGATLEVAEDRVELCRFGLHASVHPWDALTYAQHEQTTLCLVELGGKVIESADKVVASKRKVLKAIDARPLFQQVALFAAEQALPIYENRYPNDSRVRDCVEVTKRYLRGEATKKELNAADAAAYAAANAAARAAADAAARAADAAYVAARAADAADAAAYAAANAAARAADAAARAADAAYVAARAADAAAYAAANAAMKRRIRDEFARLVNEALEKV